MPTDTLYITNNGNAVATQIVAAGDGNTLIANNGPNTVWIGDTNAIQPADGSGVVALSPNSTYAVDGKSAMYAIVAVGLPSNIATIAGGLNFFQPVSSITIPTGATSGERIVLNGATGTITGYDSSSTGDTNGITFVIAPNGIFMYT
jgi:hypothetical protein